MRARILAVVLLAAFAAPAQAAYPEKPIRFVVPSAAGGSVDVLMRILTQQLSAQMGAAFVVENKPGASFVPGTMDIVKAAPEDRKSTRLNSSHLVISYAVFCLKKKKHIRVM